MNKQNNLPLTPNSFKHRSPPFFPSIKASLLLPPIHPHNHLQRKRISSMAKDPSSILTLHTFCGFLIAISFLSSLSLLYWSYSNSCTFQTTITAQKNPPFWSGYLPSFPSSWNHLTFAKNPPSKLLKIALFVKKWPRRNLAGGLERHALTLHVALAKRGHEVHIFTTSSNSSLRFSQPNMHFHFSEPSPGGYLNQAVVWQHFEEQNSTQRPFDVVHTESVGLSHLRARNLTHIAVSWHGIAYETIHSDIVQDLVRNPEEARSLSLQRALNERILKVIEEVKFFPNYAHHVATSDHVGDVLKRIYMIPEERVHVILNGVDEEVFKPDLERGLLFRKKFGVPQSNKALVLGMAGRLVKDKGHPIMFEALKQVLMDESLRKRVFVLVAGDGPWAGRYRNLGPNLLVLGPLEQTQLAGFYNSLDIFVNPTLRAQGLDHTLLEAMISGKPVMATRFASITESVIVNSELGYTFSPTVASLREALHRVLEDGKEVLEKKGEAARHRASKLFTASKMACAYERLFLCISNNHKEEKDIDYCTYPLSLDRSGDYS